MRSPSLVRASWSSATSCQDSCNKGRHRGSDKGENRGHPTPGDGVEKQQARAKGTLSLLIGIWVWKGAGQGGGPPSKASPRPEPHTDVAQDCHLVFPTCRPEAAPGQCLLPSLTGPRDSAGHNPNHSSYCAWGTSTEGRLSWASCLPKSKP